MCTKAWHKYYWVSADGQATGFWGKDNRGLIMYGYSLVISWRGLFLSINKRGREHDRYVVKNLDLSTWTTLVSLIPRFPAAPKCHVPQRCGKTVMTNTPGTGLRPEASTPPLWSNATPDIRHLVLHPPLSHFASLTVLLFSHPSLSSSLPLSLSLIDSPSRPHSGFLCIFPRSPRWARNDMSGYVPSP